MRASEVTKSRVRKALKASARKQPGTKMWTWNPRHTKPEDVFWHSEEDALTITRACLYLDRPVTDIVSGGTWLALILRVIDLEDQVNGGTA